LVVSVYNTSKRSHFNRALLCRLLNSQRHLILSVSLSPIRVLFPLLSQFISSFLHGTCSLSASCPFHQLVRLLEADRFSYPIYLGQVSYPIKSISTKRWGKDWISYEVANKLRYFTGLFICIVHSFITACYRFDNQILDIFAPLQFELVNYVGFRDYINCSI